MKIEHHYNLQTKITPCVNNIFELAVNHCKRILALKHVTLGLMWQRLRGSEVGPESRTPGPSCVGTAAP